MSARSDGTVTDRLIVKQIRFCYDFNPVIPNQGRFPLKSEISIMKTNIHSALVASIGLAFLCPVSSFSEDAGASATPPTKASLAADKAGGLKGVSLPAPTAADRVSVEDDFEAYGLDEPFGFYGECIRNKLSVGMGYYFYSFDKTDRPADPEKKLTYVGNVNHIEEEEDSGLTFLVQYRVCDYASIGASYAKFSADTLNWNNGEGDGYVEMSGPLAFLELRYPFWGGVVTPHAGAGLAFLTSDFKEDTWWYYGYGDPDSWVRLGSESKLRGVHYREIRVDDCTAFFWTAGLSIKPFRWFELDASVRFMEADPDCRFGYKYGNGKFDPQLEGDFDLSNTMYVFTGSIVF